MTEDLSSLSWTNKSVLGLKGEEWLLMEVTPLPPKDELESVVMDIIENREIGFRNGQVRRWHENPAKKIKSDPVLKNIISKLQKRTFQVAVLINEDNEFFGGQPIVFAINPIISYLNFPDHPHLNVPSKPKGVFLPDSLCYGYTMEPKKYLGTDYQRYIRTLDEVSLWLFRHQIWEMYRGITGKGKWIGNHYKHGLPAESYPGLLNPRGRCRCGRPISYLQCHLKSDLRSHITSKWNADGNKTRLEIQNSTIKSILDKWEPYVQRPLQNQFEKLNVLKRLASQQK